jgi:hypothetical protein
MTRAASVGASRMNRGRSSSVRSLDDLTRAAGALRASKICIFVSFDVEHDGELFKLLLAQSGAPGSGFEVLGSSERLTSTDVWSESLRLRIRNADQMIVICGEHTRSSPRVSTELRIAREEQTPYFLLWGRREIMCTKPVGAKSDEGMYNWTRQILQDQITFTSRRTSADVAAEIQRNSTRQGQSNPSGVAP